jgi:hypothetical protein
MNQSNLSKEKFGKMRKAEMWQKDREKEHAVKVEAKKHVNERKARSDRGKKRGCEASKRRDKKRNEVGETD